MMNLPLMFSMPKYCGLNGMKRLRREIASSPKDLVSDHESDSLQPKLNQPRSDNYFPVPIMLLDDFTSPKKKPLLFSLPLTQRQHSKRAFTTSVGSLLSEYINLQDFKFFHCPISHSCLSSKEMCRNWFAFALVCFVLLSGFSSVSATPPAKLLSAAVSNVVSALVKWLWSLKSNTKTAVSSRSMLKFEGGYTVETVFDGSKLGIEPYSVEVSPSGELLLLDSENSNIYKISTRLSKFGRPKLITGSFEGYPGHVDGKLRDARMNHPKGLTVDERGNIYVADTMNMAIRKISDGGVTTIAGGKWARGGGHVDGPSEDAKFSNDFDVVYSASSCSLLIIDRGSQAIREIQLHDDDCNYPHDGGFNLGLAVLVAAGFFGYMLALLQRRLQILFSSTHGVAQEPRTQAKQGTPKAPYESPRMSVRPPFIPDEDEPVKSDEGLFGSLGRLILNTSSTVGEILGVIFSGFRRKPVHYQFQQHYQQPLNHSNTWPVQDSFVIPDEDEPPSIETRSPTSQKAYPIMTKDMEQNQHLKQNHHLKQNQGFYSNWGGSYHHHHHHQQQQQIHLQRYKQQQQQQNRHYMPNPKTYYEKSCETNEIVFGAVQEQNGRREAVVIKAVDYGDPRYNHHNIRPRFNYVGYSDGY
ncbi:hypothetical protein SADUNF_Sadunf16G0082400 [Salix dunnii]|uniref:NHL domain-containing protein n=1 Tax=Salix dunnii TaxID=1413687 RepID=A0A835J8R2_9ROSI|nr:hypothetical protein SADUNF_Sadunf16G0082400 [Salix dunnii]